MRKKERVFFSLVIFFTLFIFSCDYGIYEGFGRDSNVKQRSSSLMNITPPSFSDSYTFLCITDVHFGAKVNRPEAKLFSYLDSLPSNLRPSFCVCLGDVVEHGKESEFNEYISFTQKLQKNYGIQTFTILGNHDLYNSGWKYYKEEVYPHSSFYSFSTNAFSYYFIDTASGTMGRDQFKSLQESLHSDGKEKIVLSHFPLYAQGQNYFTLQNTTERDRLIILLGETKTKLFLSGHTHKNLPCDLKAFYEYNLTSFGHSSSWLLVHVNENTKSVSWELKS